ncbi:MAG: VWA domain-containing protein [Bacteroidetes bacterium]|nr:VWA domain-containing protein [Bacteroidota bacterium]
MKRLSIILILLLAATLANAQPRLELRLLKSNTPDYYYYQLYFATFCGDSVIYDLQKQQLILEEQLGRIDTNDFLIDRYASPDRNSCYEIVLAFDNSSSVGADLPSIVSAGRAFIDTMSKTCDNASVISFDDLPTVRTFLTNDRDALRAAIDGMGVSGRRALYDGISAGVTTLYTGGTARVQAVLAFTTGNDNSSGTNLDQLLDDVRHYGIRVFIIALGTSINEEPLRTLCTESGGVFYHANAPDDLLPMYRRFAGFIQREYDEHRITRRTKDVTMRNLYIRMRLEACNDSIWVQRIFNPLPVTSVTPTSAPVTIELGQSYPNPVSRTAEVRFQFSLTTAGSVRLELFDLLGRCVATVVDNDFSPGSHLADYSPSSLNPGIYFYRLTNGSEFRTGKLTVIE